MPFTPRNTGLTRSSDQLQQVLMNMISTAAKAGERGVGLGLSVAYGIIEEHGGAIQVDSVLPEGTVFEIALLLNRPSDKGKREGGSHDEDKDTDC